MGNELLIAIEELLDRKLDEKLDQKLDQKFTPVYERLDKLDTRVDHLEQKVEQLDVKVEQLDVKVDRLDEQMHRMGLTLENEIRPNIIRVAEGHLDLSRKLSEALKRSAEMEMMAVKVNYHDMQIRNLKEFGALL